jgi:hypothetical protein
MRSALTGILTENPQTMTGELHNTITVEKDLEQLSQFDFPSCTIDYLYGIHDFRGIADVEIDPLLTTYVNEEPGGNNLTRCLTPGP